MKHAVLIGAGKKNEIFNPGSQGNRDDCYDPYIQLKDHFPKIGIELNTTDIFPEKRPVFQLALNARKVDKDIPAYLLSLETPLIHPDNDNVELIRSFRRVLRFNDEVIDNDKFLKIYLPNKIHKLSENKFNDRENLCCMIAGNKSVTTSSKIELYSERIKDIRWFEGNAPKDFELYGVDWDIPPRTSRITRIFNEKIWGKISQLKIYQPFPSYKGQLI